jgi:uncharacterized protein YeaO (DUF488 family)
MIKIKRAYEAAKDKDGYRILIDRLWPRGIKKSDLVLDEWAIELAPTSELRRSFGHDPSKWKEFRTRYQKELRAPQVREKIAKPFLEQEVSNMPSHSVVYLRSLIQNADFSAFF